jgi:hypothetical protein
MCFRLKSIVRATAELEVRSGRFPTISERHDMVELEQATLGAPAACPDEGTLSCGFNRFRH